MAGSPVMRTAITVDGGINSRWSAAPGAGINKKGGREGEGSPDCPASNRHLSQSLSPGQGSRAWSLTIYSQAPLSYVITFQISSVRSVL